MKNGARIILSAIGLWLGACGGAPVSQLTSSSDESVSALGDFSLKDVDGNTHLLSDYLGKQVIVLAFFATWCEPCKMELTDLKNDYRQRGDLDYIVLAIAMDEPETQGDVRLFAKQRRFGFPVLLDTEQEAQGLFNPKREAPFVVVIDTVPSVYWTHYGYVPGDDERLQSVVRAAVTQRFEE